MALAMQLVLSLGHVHIEGVAHTAPLITAHVTGNSHGARHGPLQHHDHQTNGGHCTACSGLAFAGLWLAAIPPALPLPAVFTVRSQTVAVAQADLDAGRIAFQPRAPPHA